MDVNRGIHEKKLMQTKTYACGVQKEVKIQKDIHSCTQ